MRVKITISYNGNFFNGWHGHKGNFIKDNLEKYIKIITKEDVQLFCAGRTDAGVHCIEQTCHFDLNQYKNLKKIQTGINFYLKNQLAILSIEETNTDFNARFDAQERQYMYLIENDYICSPFLENKVCWITAKLNMAKMEEACEILSKNSDFTIFMPQKYKKRKLRDMYGVTIEKVNFFNRNLIGVFFRARSFGHHQVRNMMSVIIAIGKCKITTEDLENHIKNQIKCKFPMAPAHGLYFYKVIY